MRARPALRGRGCNSRPSPATRRLGSEFARSCSSSASGSVSTSRATRGASGHCVAYAGASSPLGRRTCRSASTGPSMSLWRRRCPLPHLRAGWRPSRSAGWISSPPSPPRRPTTITACRSTRHTTIRAPRRVAGGRRSISVPREAMAPGTSARTSPTPGWSSLVPEVMSGRHDSNVRPLRPERSALARLSYAPSGAAGAGMNRVSGRTREVVKCYPQPGGWATPDGFWAAASLAGAGVGTGGNDPWRRWPRGRPTRAVTPPSRFWRGFGAGPRYSPG